MSPTEKGVVACPHTQGAGKAQLCEFMGQGWQRESCGCLDLLFAGWSWCSGRCTPYIPFQRGRDPDQICSPRALTAILSPGRVATVGKDKN